MSKLNMLLAIINGMHIKANHTRFTDRVFTRLWGCHCTQCEFEARIGNVSGRLLLTCRRCDGRVVLDKRYVDAICN